jgi:hypothetical protein
MNRTYRTTATTLHEYRLQYPWTAPAPTLTQSRMLWYLLEKQDQMEAARSRRRVQRRRIAAAFGYAFAHPWRALNGEWPSRPA